MSSVAPVPELAATSRGPLTIADAWRTLRRYGPWPLARESFVRFRYGDGFSHARALGLQLSLAAIPLVIAAVGLSSVLQREAAGVLLRRTILELTPAASDALVRSTLAPSAYETRDTTVAVVLALVFALVALTTAMGQLERGANRIYGIQRDRRGPVKYGRAAVLAVLAGLPAMAGFAILVTAEAFAEAVESVYALDDDMVLALTRPIGTVLLLAAVTVMLRAAPARRQPPWSLLALGGLVALAMWLGLTALLAGFLHLSTDIGSAYGPLTGVMALLVWAQLTAGALFLALAVSAQMEAAHVGRIDADAHQQHASHAARPSRAAAGGTGRPW